MNRPLILAVRLEESLRGRLTWLSPPGLGRGFPATPILPPRARRFTGDWPLFTPPALRATGRKWVRFPARFRLRSS